MLAMGLGATGPAWAIAPGQAPSHLHVLLSVPWEAYQDWIVVANGAALPSGNIAAQGSQPGLNLDLSWVPVRWPSETWPLTYHFQLCRLADAPRSGLPRQSTRLTGSLGPFELGFRSEAFNTIDRPETQVSNQLIGSLLGGFTGAGHLFSPRLHWGFDGNLGLAGLLGLPGLPHLDAQLRIWLEWRPLWSDLDRQLGVEGGYEFYETTDELPVGISPLDVFLNPGNVTPVTGTSAAGPFLGVTMTF